MNYYVLPRCLFSIQIIYTWLDRFQILLPHEPQSKKLKKKRKERHVVGPCQRTKKAMEYDNDSDANCKWCALERSQKRLLVKGLKESESEDDMRSSILQQC